MYQCHHTVAMGRKAARPIRVLIVDDHRTFAQALSLALGLEPDLLPRAVSSAAEAAAAMDAEHPDVVLLDVVMPGIDGIEVAQRIAARAGGVRVLVLSEYQDDLLKSRSLRAGALGYLSKNESMERVIEAVRRVHAGEDLVDPAERERLLRRAERRRWQHATERQRADRLSARESEILQLMADGLGPGDIVGRLSITPNTLRTHVQNILTKLGVHSKTQAVMVAIRQGKVSART